MRWSHVALGCALIALGTLATSCSDDAKTQVIESTRVVEGGGPTSRPSSAQRFGVGNAAFGAANTASLAAALGWTVPPGWEQLPVAPPRTGSFAVPGGVDCSITSLPGTAGGVHSNVNRWRSQMGMPALSPAQIDALPHQDLLGKPATRIDMVGAYRGMREVADEGEARMLGLILSESSRTLFVKLVGPSTAVDKQVANFDALVASIKAGAAPSGHEGHNHAPGDETAHAGEMPSDSAHAGIAPDDAAHAGFSGGDDLVTGDPHGGSNAGLRVRELGETNPLGLSWAAPPGWSAGPTKTMRLVTLIPDDAPSAECYVVVLSGDAGGLLANLNLWRNQMGQPPWSSAEFEAADTLLQLDGLGRPGVRVEIEGRGAAAGLGMFGVVCPLETHTVFVKLLGRLGDLNDAREAFTAFCKSLER